LDSDEVVSKAQVSTFETDGKVPFATVDEVPVFPGCENADNKRKCFNKAMQKHISKNFNYPQEAQDKGVQGRVSTMFTISENGSIQNVRMRGPDQLLEKEAARIIARLPKMIPGKHKGKAVGVPYSIPITFKLQGNNSEKEVSPLGLSFNTDPIYYIDGEESSKEQLNLILPDDIESVFVLKGEAAVAKYGNKAANGVVEVITKKDRNKPVNFKLSEIAGKTPLLIINGEESELSVAQIDPDEVVTMQVLKGAAAEEKYGEKGKNGVVEITLKKQD
jgi:TonB family protein